MLLGSHLSIAGGMHHAIEKAHQFGFDTLALFIRNQRQWRVPALRVEDVQTFRTLRQQFKIGPIIAHGSYLLNLAGEDWVRDKSIDAISADLERCDRLGIDALVIHPGACVDRENGLRRIADGLGIVFDRRQDKHPPKAPPSVRAPVAADSAARAVLLLESTAGSGSILCSTFEELAWILAAVGRPDRLAVCLDTCHIFAAGYEIRARHGYLATMRHFDKTVGLGNLRAIHINDSVKGLGSRVDRHAHIGQGQIGLEGFANFVNDRRLSRVPMLLETPKGIRPEDGLDWDLVNAQALRALVRRRQTPRAS